MNKDNAKEFLPIVVALAEGKTIQFQVGGLHWQDQDIISFGCEPSRYRIKPEPAAVYVICRGDGTSLASYDDEKTAVERCNDTRIHGRRGPYTVKKFVEQM